jgi:hypothetical protein
LPCLDIEILAGCGRTATAWGRHIRHASWETRKSGPHREKPAPRLPRRRRAVRIAFEKITRAGRRRTTGRYHAASTAGMGPRASVISYGCMLVCALRRR